MDAKLKQIVTALCVLVISGLAAANCGSCSSGKEACPSNCKKACCSEPEKKACPADCQKACCTQAAPDFTLEDLGGKEVHLGKLKGKIVVLEWTNYDCPFVKAHYSDETKTVAKLIEKYAKKDVVWLTINSTHYATTETNREWAKKNGLKQTILVDRGGKVGKLFKAKTTPHVFVIDKKGQLVYQGAIDNAPMGKKPEKEELVNYVDKAISQLLEGNKVEITKTKPYGCSVKYAK